MYTRGVSKGVKVLLIVLGLCFTAIIAVIAAGVFWVTENADQLKKGAEEIGAEAEAFAANADQTGCMDETLVRLKACGAVSPVCDVKELIFLRVCLDRAAPTPGFCEGVPKPSDIMASTQWALEQCTFADAVSTNRCNRMQQARQRHCHGG